MNVIINTGLAPSPVPQERVGERVLTILQMLFIKFDFIFKEEVSTN
jgi:hypothetical protein